MAKQLKIDIAVDGQPYSSATVTRDGTGRGIDVAYRCGERKLKWKSKACGAEADGVAAGVLFERIGRDLQEKAGVEPC